MLRRSRPAPQVPKLGPPVKGESRLVPPPERVSFESDPRCFSLGGL